MKTIGKIAGVVAAVALIATGIGAALGGTMVLSILGTTIAATTIASVASAVAMGASLLAGKPKMPANSPENTNRLRATIDPRTFRKTAVGTTALATDIRDEEFTDDQAYLHRFIVCASHECESIDEIWLDDKQAWTLAGGVQGEFVGYLTVDAVPLGNTAFNISARMGASRKFTGLANVHLRYKLTGNTKKTDSPFAQGITTRVTIRGKGARMYDPRLDTTAGGSGAHRADDQDTWEWDDDACNNPPLQLLFYLLGWRINGELAVGKGIPKERIDLASFAAAANICDESVTAAGGGTEPRYRSAGVWSEGDNPTTVIDMFKACMNADLDDVDGKLRLTIFTDDTFASDADFTADDVLGAFEWTPIVPLDQSFNVIAGSYTDPSDTSLYQQVDYPRVEVASPDGIDRIETLNLPMVQSPGQAQRLASLRVQRQAFGGMFTAEFQATAWRAQKNSIVRLTFPPLGFVNKVFRVAEMDLRVDGVVPLVLREEDPDIYTAPAVTLPTSLVDNPVYDPSLDPIIDAIDSAASAGAIAGVQVRLSKPFANVLAGKDNVVTSYTNAAGTVEITDAAGVDISADFTLSTGSNPQTLTVNYTGMAYDVSAGFDAGEDAATVEIVATGSGPYTGTVLSATLTLGKHYPLLLDSWVNANEDNALVPDAPAITVQPFVAQTWDNGNKSIRLTFTLAFNDDPTHKNSIDGYEIVEHRSTGSGSYAFNGSDLPGERRWSRYLLPGTATGTLTFDEIVNQDAPANLYYQYAIYAIRTVNSGVDASGVKRSAAAISTTPFRPSATQNWAGTINGTMTAAQLGSLFTNYNGDNDQNASTPTAPTSVAVSAATFNNDGTADISVGWSATNNTTAGDPANNDGFVVGLYPGTGNITYVPATHDPSIIWQQVGPSTRGVRFPGMPADRYYTAIVKAVRVVATSVATTRVKESGAAQNATAVRPTASPSMYIAVNGEPAANVSQGVIRANAAITGSNQIATAAVLTGSISSNQIDLRTYASSSSTVSLAEQVGGDTSTQTSAFSGGDLVLVGSKVEVQGYIPVRLRKTNPVLGTTYDMTIEVALRDVTAAADMSGSPVWTLYETWQAASATGTFDLSQILFPVRWLFTGLTAGHTFRAGYKISVTATNGAQTVGTKYLLLREPRAST